MMMNKEGQFYLIGVFIIIIVLSGLSYVYNESRVIEGIDGDHIVDEIIYESNQLIDNRVYAGISDMDIAGNIKDLAIYYSNRYPGTGIVMVYGTDSSSYKIDKDSVTPFSGGVVPVSIGGSQREVNMASGRRDFHVLVSYKQEGENTIIQR